ncbi:MAG: DUF1800 domain-containing protein [Microthrixaceae bacterium]|nr:DUF1800 domain-containing protein [Microthrixaceae bacterium]
MAVACAPAAPGTTPTVPAGGGGSGGPDAWSSATGMHIARRLTWGATPGLAAHISQMGLQPWLEEQLNPAALDDSHLAPMLATWQKPNQSAAQIKASGEDWKVAQEMAAHETIRRSYSRRQLHELVSDFWFDHFNVDVNHSAARPHLPGYDRDVIRAHAFGRFADLLPAVATHPAMLHYLDQASSRADHGRTPNENFAREVLELHTVGSSGGYEEDDISAVAHLLSGWSVTDYVSGFTFRASWHDMGPMAGRTVLGWSPGSLTGEAAGRAFLNHIAHHPATARRICHKLAVRLIGDHIGSGDAVVNRAVGAYQSSGTSITEVIRTLVLSGEFADSAGAKVRRPASLLTQLIRALDIAWQTPSNPDSFLWRNWNALAQLGNANHAWPAPNGYPDANGFWLSVGSLVSRWNMPVWLVYNSVDGMPYDAAATQSWAPNRKWGEWLDALATRIAGEPWPPELRASILSQYGVTDQTVFRSWDHHYAKPIITVLLQTPGFQRS